MKKNRVFHFFAFLSTATFLFSTSVLPQQIKISAHAKRLHQQAIVFDTHSDTPGNILDENFDIGIRNKTGHMDIPRMIEGGLDVQVFALWVAPKYIPDNAAKRALDMWDAAFQNIQKYPDKIAVAYTAADAEKIVGSGKIAIFFGVEGGHAIQNDLGLLRVFYQLGVRYMTLTWMNTNDWADASGDTARWGGLNEFGEKVVREMNRLGMIVDISHVSDDTFWDVMRVSKKPVIASHSCCRALANHFRNMSDDMLRALAKNGGVIGINYYAGYLDDKYEPAVDKIMKSAQPELDALEAKYPDHNAQYDREKEKIYDKYRSKYPKVSINRLIEHIDHAVKVAGIDHVGLGSDFDGISAPPAGLEDVTKLPRITQMLLDRGYTDEQIKKILGGNFLRVYREVIGE